MSINKILLNNCTSLIQKYGIVENKFLMQCHIHSNFLSNLRRGQLKKPSFENVYCIAKFFNVSIDSLVCYQPSRELTVIPKCDIRKRDSQIMSNAYAELDSKGKFAVCQRMKKEQERMKLEKKFTVTYT